LSVPITSRFGDAGLRAMQMEMGPSRDGAGLIGMYFFAADGGRGTMTIGSPEACILVLAVWLSTSLKRGQASTFIWSSRLVVTQDTDTRGTLKVIRSSSMFPRPLDLDVCTSLCISKQTVIHRGITSTAMIPCSFSQDPCTSACRRRRKTRDRGCCAAFSSSFS
jgi:hypothetical protein